MDKKIRSKLCVYFKWLHLSDSKMFEFISLSGKTLIIACHANKLSQEFFFQNRLFIVSNYSSGVKIKFQ